MHAPRAGILVATVLCGLILLTGYRRPTAAEANRPPDPAASSWNEFVAVTESALPSAVKITTASQVGPKFPNPFAPEAGPDGTGSGVAYRTGKAGVDGQVECLILTNHHVVEGEKSIRVHFRNRLNYSGEVVGSDPVTEVALLRVRVPEKEIPPAIKIRTTPLWVAEKVLAIGNPLGQPFTVTQGIVSSVSCRPGITGLEDYVQTDAAVNPGNSGGPLIDARNGHLIGLNTAILGGKTNVGIAFAIPADLAAEVAERMLSNKGKVWHGFAGVRIDDTSEGVVVLEVTSRPGGQPLKPNDILVEINGEKVVDGRTSRRLFDRCKPGSKAKVTVKREGKLTQLEVLIDDFEKHFRR